MVRYYILRENPRFDSRELVRSGRDGRPLSYSDRFMAEMIARGMRSAVYLFSVVPVDDDFEVVT